jgi:transposase
MTVDDQKIRGTGIDPGGRPGARGEKGQVVRPGCVSLRTGQASAPDPEVVEKASRRRFTADYKLRIVREAEACSSGELGAMIRREGLYSSNLACWRRQAADGQLAALTPQKRGRRGQPVNPLSKKVLELEQETERLRQRLQQAEEIIDLQKKISDIRGMSLKNLDA